jgi:CubicO group peptidase (beta-lactamase class C family)
MILNSNFVKHLIPLLLLADSSLAAKTYHYPPLGPVLPAPTHPGISRDVKNAIEALTEDLKSVTDKLNSTAVSIGVTYIHEGKPFLNFHHRLANLDPRGVKVVDDDSVYRIGSVSKAYTVLGALLLKGAKMNDPVTEYLPELRDLKTQQSENNAITTVDWDKILLLALASHMGGIGADCES